MEGVEQHQQQGMGMLGGQEHAGLLLLTDVPHGAQDQEQPALLALQPEHGLQGDIAHAQQDPMAAVPQGHAAGAEGHGLGLPHEPGLDELFRDLLHPHGDTLSHAGHDAGGSNGLAAAPQQQQEQQPLLPLLPAPHDPSARLLTEQAGGHVQPLAQGPMVAGANGGQGTHTAMDGLNAHAQVQHQQQGQGQQEQALDSPAQPQLLLLPAPPAQAPKPVQAVEPVQALVPQPPAVPAELLRVAGVLYCLYCLHQTQPLRPRTHIHLPLALLSLLVSAMPCLVQDRLVEAVAAFRVGGSCIATSPLWFQGGWANGGVQGSGLGLGHEVGMA